MEEQRRVADVLAAYRPDISFIESTDPLAHWDYIGFNNMTKKVSFVMEVKARETAGKDKATGQVIVFTEQYMRERGYLITKEKVVQLASLARMLNARGYVAVNIIPERKIAVIRYCDRKGVNLFGESPGPSRTQASCNGRGATRDNTVIPVHNGNTNFYTY